MQLLHSTVSPARVPTPPVGVPTPVAAAVRHCKRLYVAGHRNLDVLGVVQRLYYILWNKHFAFWVGLRQNKSANGGNESRILGRCSKIYL